MAHGTIPETTPRSEARGRLTVDSKEVVHTVTAAVRPAGVAQDTEVPVPPCNATRDRRQR